MKKRTKILILFHFIIFIVSINVFGSDYAKNSAQNNIDNKKVAIMTFANYTGNYRALEVMMPEIIKAVENKIGPAYHAEELRNVLRKYRIRSSGKISQDAAQIIREEFQIDYLILGSLDYFKQTEPFEVGLSLRIIDLATMQILFSASQSATNLDFMKIFGFNRINEIQKLSKKVIGNIFKNFDDDFYLNKLNNQPNKIRVAVIELDNSSQVQHAGKIVSNQITTYLTNKDFQVVEPGIIQEFMIKNQSLYKGEIDIIAINKLYENFKVDLIVTGFVDNFKFSQGYNGETSSEVELDIRVLDAAHKEILFMSTIFKKGESSEKFFKLGKCYSLGRLSNKVIDKLLNKFLKEKRYEKI